MWSSVSSPTTSWHPLHSGCLGPKLTDPPTVGSWGPSFPSEIPICFILFPSPQYTWIQISSPGWSWLVLHEVLVYTTLWMTKESSDILPVKCYLLTQNESPVGITGRWEGYFWQAILHFSEDRQRRKRTLYPTLVPFLMPVTSGTVGSQYLIS